MPRGAFIDGYQPHDFNDFSGGLNLRDKADAVGPREAIDLLNVTFTERGAVRQRDGYSDLTPADLTNRVDSMAPFANSAGLMQLVLGANGRLDAVDQAGATVASQAGLAAGRPFAFVRFGDPTHEYLYAANGADTIQRYNGAAFTSGAALATVDGVAAKPMPKAGALAVTAATPGSTSGTNASNRLIATAFGTQAAAGPNGAVSTPSRVYFSNAGQPEVWETDGAAGPPVRGRNYIDLTPGDGESITAAVTWRELVFIFKQTKFFVLWGEGTAADGTPTFQVREVVNAIGLASPQAIAVGRDGVYFANRRGIYLTDGNDPRLLSDIVSPMWTQDPDVYFLSAPINLAQLDLSRMLWHMERLYFAVATGGSSANDRVLVYDTQHGWWSLYDLPAAALASFRSGVQPEVHFGYSGGPKRVGHLVLGTETDVGARMVSRWRSGWGDYASSQVKTLRETKLWGSGVLAISFSTDFNRAQRASRDVPLGVRTSWPAVGTGTWGNWLAGLQDQWPGGAQINSRLVRYSTRATTFSTQFSNSPLASSWSVHRVVRHLREVREPSVT